MIDDEDLEDALMKRLGLDSAADARPDGEMLLKSLKYFDLTVKIEVTMLEIQQMLLNISIAEIFLFVVTAVFFLKVFTKMNNFWLFIPHLARGIAGIIIHNHFPKSHDVIESLNFEKEKEINFKSVQ